jgi:hypothetical protein
MSETFAALEIHLTSTRFTNVMSTCTITIEADEDTEDVSLNVQAMLNSGWEIGAVHAVTDYDRGNSATVVNLTEWQEIEEFHECASLYDTDATRLLAYGELYGWNLDNFRRHRSPVFQRGFFILGDSREEVAREYYGDAVEEIPSGIVVDWSRTADSLSASGHNFHDRNGFHMILEED